MYLSVLSLSVAFDVLRLAFCVCIVRVTFGVLCYVCYVMLCYAMLCYVMSCYAMLCYVMLCYAML